MALDPLALGLWMPVIHHESWKLNTGPLEEQPMPKLPHHLPPHMSFLNGTFGRAEPHSWPAFSLSFIGTQKL